MAIRSSSDYQVLDVISTKGKKNCVRLLKAKLLKPLNDGNDVVCVKTFTSPKYSMVREALGEAQTLLEASVQHPSICKMHDCYTEIMQDRNYSFGIVMEYFERGDLEDLIQYRKYHSERWSEVGLFSLFEQLVDALEVLQNRKICHRDIKPQNIFVATDTLFKIGDFGVSRKEVCEGSSQRTLVGTPVYFSPLCAKAFFSGEIYRQEGVHHNMYKSDVFSLGLTFLRMATLKNVRGLNAGDQDNIDLRIAKLSYSPQLQLLLRTMLTIEERQRPDFIQLSQYIRTVSRFKLERPFALEQDREAVEDLCEEAKASVKQLTEELSRFTESAERHETVSSDCHCGKQQSPPLSYSAVSTSSINISQYEAGSAQNIEPDDLGLIPESESQPITMFPVNNHSRLQKKGTSSCCVGAYLGKIAEVCRTAVLV